MVQWKGWNKYRERDNIHDRVENQEQNRSSGNRQVCGPRNLYVRYGHFHVTFQIGTKTCIFSMPVLLMHCYVWWLQTMIVDLQTKFQLSLHLSFFGIFMSFVKSHFSIHFSCLFFTLQWPVSPIINMPQLRQTRTCFADSLFTVAGPTTWYSLGHRSYTIISYDSRQISTRRFS